jgi:hypothetical protein
VEQNGIEASVASRRAKLSENIGPCFCFAAAEGHSPDSHNPYARIPSRRFFQFRQQPLLDPLIEKGEVFLPFVE